MKCVLGVLFLMAAIVAISAYPQSAAEMTEDRAEAYDNARYAADGQMPVEHVRAKRATCDLGSATSLGHAACATHCLVKGFRGGWCDGRAVCNCRR